MGVDEEESETEERVDIHAHRETKSRNVEASRGKAATTTASCERNGESVCDTLERSRCEHCEAGR